MIGIKGHALASVTLLAAIASAKSISLNFDDIQISNTKSCGKAELGPFLPAYHGTLPADNISGNLVLYNTTATAACNAKKNDAVHLFDQKRATSGSNVAFAESGAFYFQIADESEKFVNDVYFDISVVFTKEEASWKAKADNVINIEAEIADFSSLDNKKTFTFHTAKDGFGPYHVHVPNTEKYIFLHVDTSIGVSGTSSQRHPTAFIDSVRLESVAI
ncbi:hypothetical protein NQ176_g504 [Zarea fungicola]|uniref:Uncharacterized protein n=1 Tax=Zarea fungicola TaxID=93591 RepID=A0ACC1NWQ4_9HYPO|nr:hypothetical protein NQ176_g504 [Lecanicillium fungicola]